MIPRAASLNSNPKMLGVCSLMFNELAAAGWKRYRLRLKAALHRLLTERPIPFEFPAHSTPHSLITALDYRSI